MSPWMVRVMAETEEPYRVRCAHCWIYTPGLREDEGGHLFCSRDCESFWRVDNKVFEHDWPARAFKGGN